MRLVGIVLRFTDKTLLGQINKQPLDSFTIYLAADMERTLPVEKAPADLIGVAWDALVASHCVQHFANRLR